MCVVCVCLFVYEKEPGTRLVRVCVSVYLSTGAVFLCTNEGRIISRTQ